MRALKNLMFFKCGYPQSKVCVGAYKDKNNAIKQLEMAKNKGFHDSYII